MSINKKVGLFGLAMHFAMVIVFLLWNVSRGRRFEPEFIFIGLSLLIASAYVVYYVVISRYLTRRKGMVNPLFIDILVGILAEFIIFTLTGACVGIFEGFRAISTAGEGMVGGLLTSLYVNILQVYGNFMDYLPTLGTLCGLVGWLVLKKTATAK
jgi:hypothetical protein